MLSLESRKEPEKETRAPDNAGTDCGSDELSQAPNENELLFELSFFFVMGMILLIKFHY